MPFSSRLSRAVVRFALEPASHRPLAALRIGIAAALIGEAAAVAGHLHDYFGPSGLVQAPVADALVSPSLPSLSSLAAAVGVSEGAVVQAAFAAYVVSLHLLLLGYRTRSAATASLLLFLALKRSASASAYGAFEFAQIGLFYCAVFPVGSAFSLDASRRGDVPSVGARIALRVLQLHLCIAYFSSGIAKAAGEQWWNGEAIWRAVMRPGHVWLDFSWLASHSWLAVAAAWATLVIEIGYAFLIWPARTRRAWVAASIGLHLGIAIALGLVFFSAVMIALNLAAFVVPDVTRSSAGAPDRRIADRSAADPRPGLP